MEVEAIINTHPLTYVSEFVSQSLTRNHKIAIPFVPEL